MATMTIRVRVYVQNDHERDASYVAVIRVTEIVIFEKKRDLTASFR